MPCALLILLLASATAAPAAVFTVNDPGVEADAAPGDGTCDVARSVCTLTAAIEEANALAGADEIELPAGTYDHVTSFSTGTDGSSQALPPITSRITIAGAGHEVTIIQRSGVPEFRLLTVEETGSLVLSGVRLTGGHAGPHPGGAVLVRGGTFVAAGCAFTSNTGSDGGAVHGQLGAVGIVRSIFDSNQAAASGGAVFHDGGLATELSIVQSTFEGNTAVEAGGAVATTGAVRITNATISGNEAATGGGLATIEGRGSFALASATVTLNTASGTGGGLAGDAVLRNTILAANRAIGGAHDCSDAGPVVSAGYDVVGTTTDCDWTPGPGDQTGTDPSPLDPGLQPLGDNGGDTRTHALRPDSPAGEAGDPAGCLDTDGAAPLVTDQRGEPRPQDGDIDGDARCDVGAFEAAPGTIGTTTTTIEGSTTTSSVASTTSSTTSSSTSSSSATTTSTSTTTTTLAGEGIACLAALPFSGGSQGPKVMVQGGVDEFWLHAPRVVWRTATFCGVPQSGLPSARVSRIALQCGGVRTIFDPNPVLACIQPYAIRSTLFADDTDAYWIDSSGLRRLPLSANVGDPTALVTDALPAPAAGARAEIVPLGESQVAVLVPDPDGGFSLHRVDRATGSSALVLDSGLGGSGLQSDGELLYYVDQFSRLIEVTPGFFPLVATTTRVVALGVDGFHVEGPREVCGGGVCVVTRYVFIGQGPSLRRHDVTSQTTAVAPVYSSPDSAAEIYGIATTFDQAVVLERRPSAGDQTDAWFVRTSRIPGTGTGDVLLTRPNLESSEEPRGLRAAPLPAGDFLYWTESRTLYRLPVTADAIPVVDIVGGLTIEVTQSVQTPFNTVPLIRDKKTYARAYAHAVGGPAPGVTALLFGIFTLPPPIGVDVTIGPLLPVNAPLTVQQQPSRTNIDHSFLFEVPTAWTNLANLRLLAIFNPNEYPPENEYANNVVEVGPLTFQPSERLPVQIVEWGFDVGGSVHYPRFVDRIALVDWVRRSYPLAGTPGNIADPSPGFRPGIWTIFDASLGARVARTHPDCDALASDKKNLCASTYTNQQMGLLRDALCLFGPDPCPFESVFFYGMIADIGVVDGTDYFPRGRACCAPNVSSGPTGPPAFRSFALWDTDETYGDWYGGHEIGHTLGRNHPSQGNTCGHGASDPGYPWTDAFIGPNSGFFAGLNAGFDVGSGVLQIPRAVLPSSQWHDVMSYCTFQWVSDYTYEGMLAGLAVEADAGVSLLAPAPRGVLPGAVLAVAGTIETDGASGTLAEVRVHENPVSSPALPQPGPYALRLLAEGGSLLAEHTFTPVPGQDEGGPAPLGVALAVPFVAGTRTLALVAPGEVVLATRTLSATAPVIDTLTLTPEPAGPVAGTLTLGWEASDADGDPLAFDVQYSRDGGLTFEPLALRVPGTMLEIDTEVLGGGTGVLRLVATDGAFSAMADTTAFTVADKSPLAVIHAPGDGASFAYGQLVTLSGEAFDLQDGSVGADGLAWTLDDDADVGMGFEVVLEEVAVGAHTVTLTATNSLLLSASATVTFTVGDELSLPGSRLSVDPPQLGFHVPPGTTAPASATLEVTNTGGGTLAFTASAAAPWLGVTPAEGEAAATLTVTVDPSVLAEGQSIVGDVTVVADGVTLHVPVVLGVGDLYLGEGGAVTTTTLPTTTTTLPLCAPADCDDADACTEDECVIGVGCSNTPLGGVAGARCLCGVVPDACEAETLPNAVARKANKACGALEAAETAADARQRKLLGKAQRLLKKAARKAIGATRGRRPKLTMPCGDALAAILTEQRARVLALRSASMIQLTTGQVATKSAAGRP